MSGIVLKGFKEEVFDLGFEGCVELGQEDAPGGQGEWWCQSACCVRGYDHPPLSLLCLLASPSDTKVLKKSGSGIYTPAFNR